MLNKIISTVMLAASSVIMALSGGHPDSLIFLFISSNKWVATVRLLLVMSMLVLSFKRFIRHNYARSAMIIGGCSLLAFGLVCALATSLGSALYDYVKPLDTMIIMEAGIVFISCALTTTSTSPSPVKVQKSAPAYRLRQKTA